MPSYPSSIISFPARADGQTIFAQHVNLLQEELAAIEAGLLTTGGVTDANIRIRRDGNGIEFGHANPAGYGNALGGHGNGKGFVVFNGEAGTAVATYKTRGIPGAVIESTNAGGLIIGTIPNGNADNQTPTPLITAAPGSVIVHAALSAAGGVAGTLTTQGLQVNGNAAVTGATNLGGVAVGSNNVNAPGTIAAGLLNVAGVSTLTGQVNAASHVVAQGNVQSLTGEIYGQLGLRERGRGSYAGEWTLPAFNAGWFLGSGAMSWTVGAGGFTTYQYMVVGKTVIFQYDITGTIGGTPNVVCQMSLPLGVAAKGSTCLAWHSNTANLIGMVATTGGSGILTMYHDYTLGTNYVAGNFRCAGTLVYAMA
jgi:hypothetical protein